MPSRRFVAASAAVLLLAWGVGCAPTPTLYTSAGGQYSVMIPGKPMLKDQDVPTPVGNVTGHIAVVDRGASGGYIINYGDFPATAVLVDRNRSLDGSCTGMVGAMNCQVREQKTVMLGQHSGARSSSGDGRRAPPRR